MSHCAWYALQTKSRFEKVAAATLEGKGFKVLLPTYRSWRRSADRVRAVDLPLFRGYLFSCFDPNHRLPILVTPGVVNIVGTGKVPVPIDPLEIEAIRRVCDSGLPMQPSPYMRAGDRIRIEYGSLRGVEGFFVRDQSGSRIIVSVSLLRRSVSVELDRTWVMPSAPDKPVSLAS